jgi:hypothetical protein
MPSDEHDPGGRCRAAVERNRVFSRVALIDRDHGTTG